MDWLLSAGMAFAAIAPVELPDKTFVATLVLSTRFRPLAVWLGVVSAFALHCLIAVAAGSVVGLLPTSPVRLVAAGLFLVGAVIMVRGARQADAEEREQHQHYQEKLSERAGPRGGWAAYSASFVLLFTAEWGDLSQLFTMGLVAGGEPATAVFLGAWGALAAVSGAAVLAGSWIVRKVRLSLVRYIAGAVCLVLATVLTVSAIMEASWS
ncbi:TMEM165/GDT1 family protein [Natronosporangium hydrolyticum]|uniref:GDT1 family protein n=1 Tax=Natronosporangium hydrolyticum TaxID=2811111 RepID=A0A895YKP2_9ACTN|nr:TMEM165/GDT1 family protein [Natronosporangium hydrolyticum]QSB14670.1 TMEM165/GDT1 family protein [Natronosporangium hydrolyticum]